MLYVIIYVLDYIYVMDYKIDCTINSPKGGKMYMLYLSTMRLSR